LAAKATVPEFFVLTTAAWKNGMTGALKAQLAQALDKLGAGSVAVRSSAAVEDGAKASWAGQFETVLGVEGIEQVARAVSTCWDSAKSERVAAYAGLHGVEVGAIAVVVQRMVPGEASGVLFTRDPDHPGHALISAGLGLGEGVVQGAVQCDTFRVDGSGAIEASLVDKDEQMLLRGGGQTELVAVDESRRNAAALTDSQIRELAAVGRRIEADARCPQDIEFTFAGGKLYVLQARPITVAIAGGQRMLWDNSNIVESYSGITTPLTFSFASRAYTIVYQLFHRVMGVDETSIKQLEPVYRRMIGLVRGRIYYNLNSWYLLVQKLPGYAFNKGALETMMGVSEVADERDAGAVTGSWLDRVGDLPRFGKLVWRLLWLDRDARVFQQMFRATLTASQALAVEQLGPDRLLVVYENAERELLWNWTPPIVNDFFCMIFYASLRKRCQALTGDEQTQLHNQLLGGEGLASAEPIKELMEIARLVAKRDGLARIIRSDAEPAAMIAELCENPGFNARWQQWLKDYGDRSPDELKLESPTLHDTPEFLLHSIRAWVNNPPRPFGDAERAARAQAEVRADALLGSWSERLVFNWVLSQARRRVATRESLRFERTRIFGFVRRLFRAFGDRYVEAGALDARDDVFYLTVDEVLGYARGTTVTTDLRGLVTLRRAEFDGYRDGEEPAQRFHTFGGVHLANRFRGRQVQLDLSADEIAGTACAPGIVTAPAMVVHDPRERPDLKGGLLVANRTDPGWVPLFATASGLLVERGSLLSHSAVVARELGLPAIVGVQGLLDWAKDGEALQMNGSTGVIRRMGDDDE